VLQLPPDPQRRFTIGREWACDMILADETVSRWHASLQWDGDGWLLGDLGSTNGTRLNGWRVTTRCRVAAGDLVSFGAATFVLADRRR
jgi:pSer/pThr/pTyr-binding forkhead associated (FHA) protein